jgi:general stress protein 26
MEKDTKEKIADYLASHGEMHLATVAADGKPMVHTVAYASAGATVWFFTDRNTRKFQNIKRNSAVAYTVCGGEGDWRSLKGLQMEGNARPVEDKAEMERAMGMMLKKFPQLAGMPPSPDMAMVRVDPSVGYYLDYTVSFMYREQAVY